MNPRVFALTLTLIAVILGLAFAVRFTQKQSLPIGEPTPSAPIPAPAETGGALTFHSSDNVTSVTFDDPVLTDGLVTMKNPLSFYGTTTAFENTLEWKVTDDRGTVVSEGFTTAASPDVGRPGPFQVTAYYDAPPLSSRGSLMVYESSAKDGEPIHVVTVPLIFAFTKAGGCQSVVRLAMRNAKADPEVMDCEKTEIVERAVCGTPTLALAIHELLKGPTPLEKDRGYETNTAPETGDPIITQEKDHQYRLTFDGRLEQGVAGSCRVGAIRAQIVQTVIAFDPLTTPEQIEIAVDGRVDDVLQP